MSHVLAIAGRELRSIFATPVAWVLMTVYLVFTGFTFFLSLRYFVNAIQQIQAYQAFHLLDQFNVNQYMIEPTLSVSAFIFLLIVPLLTMRTFAEERAQGTIELLLTSPITAWQLVLGKYLAVLVMLGVLVGLFALYPLVLFWFGDPELLQSAAGVMGLFLYGAALAALGCFISSLTRSQMIAAVVAVIAGVILFMLDSQADNVQGAGQEVLRWFGTRLHFDNLARGRVHSEDLVYFGVMIVFFLSTLRASVESMRWR